MNRTVAISLSGLIVLATMYIVNRDHATRYFSTKDKGQCAVVSWNESAGEWNVYNSVDTAVFVEEKDALAFSRNVCGYEGIKISDKPR
jgi:hypothetical protein